MSRYPGPAPYIAVRMAKELLDRFISEDGTGPVVILGVERFEDGTYDMTVREPEPQEAVAGRGLEVTSYVVYGNGTRQLTLKPKESPDV